MMVACIAHVYAKPFVVDELDVYEFVSLITSSLLFFLGALTKGSPSYGSVASYASLILMIAFVVYAMVFAGYIARLKLSNAQSVQNIDQGQIELMESDMKVAKLPTKQ